LKQNVTTFHNKLLIASKKRHLHWQQISTNLQLQTIITVKEESAPPV